MNRTARTKLASFDSGTYRKGGFSIVELLVTIAVSGLLLTLAFPAWEHFRLRTGRVEARQELFKVASDLERYHASTHRYVADARPLLAPVTPGRTLITANGRYRISVAPGPSGIDSSYIATATALGSQAGDLCDTLTINHDGVRGATGASVEECW